MFVSIEFWLFVAVVLVLYYLVPRRWQNGLLLAASYAIYVYLEPRFVLLLAGLTLFNFWLGRRLVAGAPGRSGYWWAGVVVNVGALALFKYGTGLADIVSPVLVKLGMANEPWVVNLLLPLGLSFYSFRALAYVFDVYNGQVEPERNLIDFGVYIAFFPQIVAGPIMRPKVFIDSLKTGRPFSQQNVVDGLTFIFMGLFYKVAIADPLFSTMTTSAGGLGELTAGTAWSEFILYTIRIYADFAGYSLLAIGVSTGFGMPVVQNFRQPYFSKSPGEFWDRWHVSLSSWIRDYIFYPMSRSLLRRWGNQRALLIQVTAFMVSMTLSGMWHGTGLKFVVWGALHGLYLSIERVFFPRARAKPKKGTPKWRIWGQAVVGIAVTLVAVSVAWVFFRMDSLTGAIVFFQRMFSSNPFDEINGLWRVKVLVPIGLILLIDIPQALTNNPLVLWQLRLFWRVLFCLLLLLGIFIFGSQTNAPFIYAGF
ncbi:MAG: hypothetical protein LCI00_26050 [Chloroflexi bacterium]|nr:hypothetical protein [Chloroflexota bacterium]MCC6895312.1 MBOAT family protein [Anaerolineae bacterium]